MADSCTKTFVFAFVFDLIAVENVLNECDLWICDTLGLSDRS